MKNCFYVAATSQHVGKTTCTLGLTACLQRIMGNVGYCKPVGQHFVELGDLHVDKDALLFSKVMGFELDSQLHSPVILGPGATSSYLDNPDAFDYRKAISYAHQQLSQMHEVIVYEGTGHPGVGSVVELSNAEVAKTVGAGVIMIIEGGIGSTIDELNRSLALFREHNVPIIGVILNKVIPEKLEKVTHYVSRYLERIKLPLLGVLPYDKSLSNPIMATINTAVKGRVIAYIENLDNRIEGIVPGSLVDDNKEFEGGKNLLLVVSHKRFSKAIERVELYQEKHHLSTTPLSGVIITGDGKHEKNVEQSDACAQYLDQYKIPVITTPLDTLGSMFKINRIEVKINTRTPWKSRRAIELIEKHINFDEILAFQPG